jgi:signal transduction histidine kinase
MKVEIPKTNFLLQFTFAILALLLPCMLAYDLYFQTNQAVLDFEIDWQSGVVRKVPEGSFGNISGFLPGDKIHTVDGVPFAEWQLQTPGVFISQVQRGESIIQRELVVVSMARQNIMRIMPAYLTVFSLWSFSIFILIRRPGQTVTRLLYAHGHVLAITNIYALAHPPPWDHPPGLLSLSLAGFYFLAPLTLHLTLTFPVTLGTAKQRKRWFFFLYAAAIFSIYTWLWGENFIRRLGEVYVLLVFSIAVVMLIYAYIHRAGQDERRRLRLIWFGTILGMLPTNLFYFIPGLYQWPFQLPVWVVGVFLILVPVSYLYAITRQNLFQIDRLINRAVVYLVLSSGILLIYLLIYTAISNLLQLESTLELLLTAFFMLIIVFSFDKTRHIVQQMVDRAFYGGWYDYPKVVETISNALSSSLDRIRLEEILTRQTAALMQIYPGVLLKGTPENHKPGAFTYLFQTDENLCWCIGPRLDGDLLSRDDERILNTLARQAEIALANVRLVEKLQNQIEVIHQSREDLLHAQHRLLLSREEERARLARELHDGPIQELVGLNIELGLLFSVEEKGPLQQALGEIRAQVQGLLGGLRQVCTDLRPPMLDTLGLGAALQVLGEEWGRSNQWEVRFNLPTDGGLRCLAEPVAVNLYRIAQESLSNTARHAHASRVNIDLQRENGWLVLSITDNGCGFRTPESWHTLVANEHFGLAGMQERAVLIGGELSVASAPGQGTRIRISCPFSVV